MKKAFRIKGCSAPHVVRYGPLNKFAYVTCKKVTGIAIAFYLIDSKGVIANKWVGSPSASIMETALEKLFQCVEGRQTPK